MNKTAIEYLTHSWSPIAMRCDPVSAGCDNCWHRRMAHRHASNHTLSEELRSARGGGPFTLLEDELTAPLRLRKPAMIGVQFMGDLFHAEIPREWQYQIWHMMARAAHHTFIVLTKRILQARGIIGRMQTDPTYRANAGPYPLPNVILGASAEDQPTADERIPLLLETPAARRMISLEPMLEAVDLGLCLGEERIVNCRSCQSTPVRGQPYCLGHEAGGLDWVVCGAETGPGRRSMELDWARSARDQCQAAGVPFFFKRDSNGNRKLDGIEYEEMPR